jgi:hypothetical protein
MATHPSRTGSAGRRSYWHSTASIAPRPLPSRSGARMISGSLPRGMVPRRATGPSRYAHTIPAGVLVPVEGGATATLSSGSSSCVKIHTSALEASKSKSNAACRRALQLSAVQILARLGGPFIRLKRQSNWLRPAGVLSARLPVNLVENSTLARGHSLR